MSLFGGAVIGIHRWRRHAPFFLVQRLANFAEIALDFKCARFLDIANKVAAHDFHRAVVTPGVRVADFVGDGMEFYYRLFFGFGVIQSSP